MGNAIDISHHLSLKLYPKIHATCVPLFEKTSCNYFCFTRRYRDGRATYLTSNPELNHFFNEENHYPLSWIHHCSLNQFKEGMAFWNVNSQFLTADEIAAAKTLKSSLNIEQGVDIYVTADDYVDLYTFASDSPLLYLTETKLYKQFILYFRQQAVQHILASKTETFSLPAPLSEQTREFPIFDLELSLYRQSQQELMFDIKKYYLSRTDPELYLSRSEALAVAAMANGFSAKEIARQRVVSHRTVEKHIINAKTKFDCTRINQLIDMLS